MGVYENLKKKKILVDREDGTKGIDSQQLDNIINRKPVQQNMWQQITDMANSMNNKVNQSINGRIKSTPSFIQNMVSPMQNLSIQQKRQIAENNSNQIKKRLSRPLWEQIQDFANDTGRTVENTWLGTKHGVEDVGNYLDYMVNGEKAQKDKELYRVLMSKDLTDDQKRMYLAQNSQFGLLLNENSSEQIAETINKALPIKVDAEMIEKMRNDYKSKLPINMTDENLAKMRQYFKDNYNKEEAEKIATTDVQAEARKKENEKIAQNIEQQTNPVAKKLAELAPSVGQMIPGMGLSAINPALGAGYFVTSAGGGYLEDAKARGMDEGQSKLYATLMGTMEGLTEELTWGHMKKAGSAMKALFTGKKAVQESAKQVATNSIKEVLKDYGIGIAENTIQEALMEPIQEKMAEIIGGEDKANWDNIWGRIFDSGVNGGLVGLITGGGEIGIKSCLGVMDKMKNGVKPTQQEVKTALQDSINTMGEEKASELIKNGTENAINFIQNENQQTTIENKLSNTQEQQATTPVQENVSNQNMFANNQKDSNKSSFSYDKINSKVDSDSNINKLTNNGIVMTYVHMNNKKTPNFGSTYGQNIEPAGQYMNVDTMQGKYKIPGAEYGTIKFNNPLVLDHINTGETGWKKTLSDMFNNKNGKQLSNEIKKAGYDGIITIDEDGYYNEVVNINGEKIDNLANNSKKVYNIINKSLTKNEKAQVASEVRRWRINQEDGIGYIDLSDQGYKSYIYNKQGSDVETLLKVNGSEEFRNFIRKGIEDGTYKKSTDINGWASNAKLQYKNNSNANDVLSNRGDSQTVSGLYDTTSGQQTGNNGTEAIEQNSGDESVENSKKSSFNLPIKENLNEVNLPTKGEEINWNEIERPEGKFRKHYQSIIESSNTTAQAKAIAKELMGTDTYIPESNKSQLERADNFIEKVGIEKAVDRLINNVATNDVQYDGIFRKVGVDDIALGERLVQYFSKTGDGANLQNVMQATAMAGTEAGRAVQLLSIINHQTPTGQVSWIQRNVDKANEELKRKYKNKKNIPQFELSSEMMQKILQSENEEQMYKNVDEVYKELGQQVPKSMSEKIDEWRYFSMLANLKTHGKNIVGNVAMHGLQRTKDKVAGVIEGAVAKFNPEMERTHTVRKVSQEVKEFAKKDLENRYVQTLLGMNEDKYNPQSRLQKARKTFKRELLNKTLGNAYKGNSTLLEVEDNMFLRPMYKKALAEYITANKIDINNITDAQLSKARKYAVDQAKEATFHQESALASALNQLGKRGNITKFALDAVVPYKKTPINVAKAGAQYSPVGLIKSALYDTYQLKNGNITINKYIDNISKGLTGTGLAFLGYALAEAGIVKASGEDDERKEKYDEEQGKQTYSLIIGGKSYSLDWLAPAGVPLFIGAETNQQFKQAKKEKNSKSTDDEQLLSRILKSFANIANGTANAMNPISEMSMLSGLTSVLSSYNKENAIGDMIVNAGKSYVNQFVPTALGQLARTTDDYERTTKSTKTGTLEKAFDSTVNQFKSKIPGLRQTLPVKTDVWGKEVKQSENLPFRAFNNFINPAKVQDVSTDKVDKELNSLYGKTKESSIIPKNIEKTFSINNTTYRMTNDEYAKYSKQFGKTAYNLLDNLVSSKEYNSLTDEQKQKAIEKIYSYAKEANKVDYAKKVKEEVKTDYIYDTMQALGNYKNQSQFINYIAKVTELKKDVEKNTILSNSDFSNTTKAIIYEHTTGKDDNAFNIIKNDVDINQYLKYKVQEGNKAFAADKDEDGNSISGTAKKKLIEYLEQNIKGYTNRLIILGSQYKLEREQQQQIVDYVNKTSKNNKEAMEKLENLTDTMIFKNNNNFLVKDGKVYYK